MKILVIIPAYNSGGEIIKVLQELVSYPELDILLVDDGSTDNTASIAKEKKIPIIRHPKNLGKGTALKSGFRYALEHHYDTVITMDADGQHPTSCIPDFLKMHKSHPEAILIGRRERSRDMPLARRMSNVISAFLISGISGRKFYDAQCGFRLIPVVYLQRELPKRRDFIFESEMLIRYAIDGIDFYEIPVPTLYPPGGATKMRYFDSTFGFIFMYISSLLKYRKRRKNDLQ